MRCGKTESIEGICHIFIYFETLGLVEMISWLAVIVGSSIHTQQFLARISSNETPYFSYFNRIKYFLLLHDIIIF